MSDRPHLQPVPDPHDQGPGTLTPPHNTDYERLVLGSTMLAPRVINDLRDQGITAGTFYRPAHESIWAAILTLHVTGRPVDAPTVTEELIRRGNLARAGGPAYLHELVATVATPESATYYGDRLLTLAAQRRDAALAARLAQAALSTDENAHTTALHLLREHLDDDARLTGRTRELPGQHVDDFLAAGADDDHYDWLIPGLLERQDRLILTAGEGHGKSTLLRQWAVQVAAGIHPFTLAPCPPQKVLIVDLENSERQTRRKLRPLRAAAGHHLASEQLVIVCKVDGLDLTNPDDQAWLDALIEHHRPDLLITGPIYKLSGGDPVKEADSKPAAMAIDALRARHDIAVILEAHTAKASGGNPKHRPKEPYGWSGWLRWPEFGLHLGQDGDLTHWRGMRDERDFPELLNRGGTWPWSPSSNPVETKFHTIRRCVQDAGEKLSNREIARRTGMPESTVRHVLNTYAMQYGAVLANLGSDDE